MGLAYLGGDVIFPPFIRFWKIREVPVICMFLFMVLDLYSIVLFFIFYYYIVFHPFLMGYFSPGFSKMERIPLKTINMPNIWSYSIGWGCWCWMDERGWFNGNARRLNTIWPGSDRDRSYTCCCWSSCSFEKWVITCKRYPSAYCSWSSETFFITSCNHIFSSSDNFVFVLESSINHLFSLLWLVLFLCAFTFFQYNSWFTFSEYGEAVTVRSIRPIHAKELATVSSNFLCIPWIC